MTTFVNIQLPTILPLKQVISLSRVDRIEGGPVSEQDLKAELARLKAENETLKKSEKAGLSLRVSEKGAVSVYGLGRFPVTLYRDQWLKLLGFADNIKSFID